MFEFTEINEKNSIFNKYFCAQYIVFLVFLFPSSKCFKKSTEN